MQNETNTTVERQAGGGVKTPEGKAKSRYNAQKHAILRETVTKYEKADAEQIYNELAEAINPKGKLQEFLVESLASNAIRLIRIAKAESELIRESLEPGLTINMGGYEAQVGYNAVERLELYSRYQTATENRIHRSIVLIRELQKYEKAD